MFAAVCCSTVFQYTIMCFCGGMDGSVQGFAELINMTRMLKLKYVAKEAYTEPKFKCWFFAELISMVVCIRSLITSY